MELSFLTIVISLAVCSLLVYAVFQYTKVRLNIVEQSQKEQALILQEFIEESSTDIHRLYKLSGNKGNQTFQPQGSIILEYANDFANDESKTASNTNTNTNTRQSTYNEPHMIHLDTAIFQNKRSNLIEISSDSEDTTESESDSDSGSGSDSNSGSESSSGSDSECESVTGNDSESESGSDSHDNDCDKIHPDIVNEIIEPIQDQISDVHDTSCETKTISDIKVVTVDLGVIQDPHSEKSTSEVSNDVSPTEYTKLDLPKDNDLSSSINESVTLQHTTSPSVNHPTPTPMTYSTMSVPELRQLLKEKYKQNPEKHPEIQKLKKAELIYALQNSPPA
jgi:hypothetical protein